MFSIPFFTVAEPTSKTHKLIIGCGRLGVALADYLSDAGEPVVIVDNHEDMFDKLSMNYSGFKVVGDATETNVLEDAHIDKASHVFAFTTHDATNLMVAQVAKEIYKVPNVIARVYNPKRQAVYCDFGITTISPTKLSLDAVLTGMEL